MSSITGLIAAMVENALRNIHTVLPALVVSAADGSANVQPLYKQKLAQEEEEIGLPQLVNLPVLKWRVELGGNDNEEKAAEETEKVLQLKVKAGDIVLVAVCERSTDEMMTGEQYLPQSGRQFDLSDGVIFGIVREGE